MTDILNKWFAESYNQKPTQLKEGTHYKTLEDLMNANGIGFVDHVWTDARGREHTSKVYNYPEGYFDDKIEVIRCIEPVEFDEPDDEGEVECYTAAECRYHGNNIVIALPVVTSADYVETYRVEDTYDDPGYSEGYYELSEDIEVGDDWSAIFSSVDVYKKCISEYRHLPYSERRGGLGLYLDEHSDAMREYTVNGDSYEENPLELVGDDFYEKYLDVVNNGFETEKGDEDVIRGYHNHERAIQDEIDRRRGKF